MALVAGYGALFRCLARRNGRGRGGLWGKTGAAALFPRTGSDPGLRSAPTGPAPRLGAAGADAGVVPVFLKALSEGRAPVVFGDGAQTRDFIHVSDVVRANLLAALAPEVGDGVFNVATGREAAVSEVLSILSSFFPDAPPAIYAPPRPGDPPRSRGLVGKAAKILGFRAKAKLSEGLASLAL